MTVTLWVALTFITFSTLKGRDRVTVRDCKVFTQLKALRKAFHTVEKQIKQWTNYEDLDKIPSLNM
jgi:hypothetical protein